MAFRDKSTGVQADFVPEDGSVEVVESDESRAVDPESGVRADFIPQGEPEGIDEGGDVSPSEFATRKAQRESVKAAEADDAPVKFAGPDKDQLGRPVEVERVEEPAPAIEPEPGFNPNPDGFAGPTEPEPEEAVEAEEPESDDEVDATPAARELAEAEGVDLSEVEGSGAEGRVTKPDVEEAVEAAGEAEGDEAE